MLGESDGAVDVDVVETADVGESVKRIFANVGCAVGALVTMLI